MFKKKKKSLPKHLPSGETLLTAAAEAGNSDALEMFLQRGADINASNKEGSNALHLAITKNHENIVKILLDHDASTELVDRTGMSALHLACLYGNPNLVRLLLNHGCCPNGSAHPNASSPLMVAMGINNDIVLLLMQFGADMNRPQSWGNNAFVRALWSGDVTLVKSMLSLATPDLSHVNASGYNIYHSMFRFKHFRADDEKANHCDMLALLTEYVNKNKTCLDSFKKALTEAMPSCVRSGCFNCFKMALPYIDIHHKYANGSDILQHAMSPDNAWRTTGSLWNYVPSKDYGLVATRSEMVSLLLEQGSSLLATKVNIIGQLCERYLPYTCLSESHLVLDMYLVFITAWGGWYPDSPETRNLFRRFIISQGMDDAARLICYAGFSPSEYDIEYIKLSKESSSHQICAEEYRIMFNANPRSLLNSAAICVRRCLCDRVTYKMPFLKLPKALEDHITLKGIPALVLVNVNRK